MTLHAVSPRSSKFLRVALCLLLLVMAAGVRAEVAKGTVHIAAGAEYGYWAPEIHEMYLRLPIKADPIGGDEVFAPRGVTIDGKPAAYVFWYVDGHTIDYDPAQHAGKAKITAFIPITWHANEQHEIVLHYYYSGKEGEERATISTPKTGGAWDQCTGGNQAFMIREEAGMARKAEPVEVEVTIPFAQFPDPERTVRATLMRAPGVFEEIPCQVYDVEKYGESRADNAQPAYVRFRVVVQMTVKAKSQTLLHLWTAAPLDPTKPIAAPLRLEGDALGGTVMNADYAIQLDKQSGQLYSWQEKRLQTVFNYVDPRKGVEQSVMHRTPDIFRTGASWSHAFEWKNPEHRVIAGPVFCETLRWGEMPWVPEAFSRVSYRFFADRPEVRVASSMRVTKDMLVKGFRMSNMIFGGSMFTHVAWPTQDGHITRITIQQAYGNDMGAPPPARFPFNTPWVAFYNREKKIGIAMITANLAYFSESAEHPNQSQQVMYASFYRGAFLYTIRSANQTYCANVRTYPTPMHVGTTMYEDVAYLPFSFSRENDKQFRPAEELLEQIRKPLVVVP